MPRHHNSFDFLRLVFALLVIITHSVVLTGGGEADFLFKLTGGQVSCSYLGVRGFFVISGFLIFKSLQRSPSIGDYLKKRFLRIFPALVVMLLVVTFLAGPFLSNLSLREYVAQGNTWRYVASALRIPIIHKTAALPGVFTHNPETNAVNGSLWTIWFELLFYGGLLGLFFLRRNTILLKWLMPTCWSLLFLLFLLGHHFLDTKIFPLTSMSAEVAVDLALYFLAGSALTLVGWQNLRLKNILLISGGIIIAASLATHTFHYLRYFGLPLSIIAGGQGFLPLFSQIRRLGEPSYGIYIYAFPVQQALIQSGVYSPVIVSLITIPIVILLGLISWWLVEVPFLALKRKG